MMNLAQQFEEAQRYARPSIARLLRKFPNDVEDILQDAARKAWQGQGQFQGIANFKTWFYRIAINEALMYLRRERWTKVPLEFEAGDDADLTTTMNLGLVDPSPSPLEWAMFEEQLRALDEEIQWLPPTMKSEAQLWLKEVETGEDGTRKARRHRMKKELRLRLELRGICSHV